MKKTWVRLSALIVAVALLAPASLLAQPGEKGDKGDKNVKEKKEVRQFIITNKSGKDENDIQDLIFLINEHRKSYHGSLEEDLIRINNAIEKILN